MVCRASCQGHRQATVPDHAKSHSHLSLCSKKPAQHQQWSVFRLPGAAMAGALTPSGPSATVFLSREVFRCRCQTSGRHNLRNHRQYPEAEDFVYILFMSLGCFTVLLPRFGIHFRNEFLQFLLISC